MINQDNGCSVVIYGDALPIPHPPILQPQDLPRPPGPGGPGSPGVPGAMVGRGPGGGLVEILGSGFQRVGLSPPRDFWPPRPPKKPFQLPAVHPAVAVVNVVARQASSTSQDPQFFYRSLVITPEDPQRHIHPVRAKMSAIPVGDFAITSYREMWDHRYRAAAALRGAVEIMTPIPQIPGPNGILVRPRIRAVVIPTPLARDLEAKLKLTGAVVLDGPRLAAYPGRIPTPVPQRHHYDQLAAIHAGIAVQQRPPTTQPPVVARGTAPPRVAIGFKQMNVTGLPVHPENPHDGSYGFFANLEGVPWVLVNRTPQGATPTRSGARQYTEGANGLYNPLSDEFAPMSSLQPGTPIVAVEASMQDEYIRHMEEAHSALTRNGFVTDGQSPEGVVRGTVAAEGYADVLEALRVAGTQIEGEHFSASEVDGGLGRRLA